VFVDEAVSAVEESGRFDGDKRAIALEIASFVEARLQPLGYPAEVVVGTSNAPLAEEPERNPTASDGAARAVLMTVYYDAWPQGVHLCRPGENEKNLWLSKDSSDM
jgi:hypothetical protein